MDREIKTLLAVAVGTPGYTPGPNFVQRKCAMCHRLCWLGPNMLPLYETGYMLLEPVCLTELGGIAGGVVLHAAGKDTGSKFDMNVINTITADDIRNAGKPPEGTPK